MASTPKMLPSSRSPPPPVNIAPHIAMRATNVMPIASAAATEPMRMSRFFTWLSSWASTPRISSRSRTWSRPWVTATTAWSGPRPVAKALGWAAGERYTVGIGMPSRCGELPDDRVELGRLLLADRLGAGGLDRELVAEPVRAADEDEADAEPDDQPAGAEERADPHQQATEGGEEDEGLDRVLAHGLPFWVGSL